MKLTSLVSIFPNELTLPISSRPYFNHSIQLKPIFSPQERAQMLEKVGLNVFFFPSEMVTGCDLLSDSGTTTMTNEQWAALHLGDEAYGSNKGYFLLLSQIAETFGKDFSAFLFHQGRASEDALFTVLSRLKPNQVIPSNGHFDTTQANIEANKIRALNLFSKELKNPHSLSFFKGDMNIESLKNLLKKSPSLQKH